MGLRPEFALHHSGYEPFLFAPVWEEANGSVLSMLSALARLGVDPWGEAARLGAMPRDKAAAALAAILARLPRPDQEAPADPALATRLVELLPEHGSVNPTAQHGHGGKAAGRGLPLLLALGALLLALQAAGWLF
jgi:hypothetical protein